MATQISRTINFPPYYKEIDEYIARLSDEGFEAWFTPTPTQVITGATCTQAVLGEKGRKTRELTSIVQERLKFPDNTVELNNIGLCAITQAEYLRYMLLRGLAVRRACYGVSRFVMENGAKGCEIIVRGKLRAQRAKSMKCKDVYMFSAGQPVKDYIDSAVRYVFHRQGFLGIKVKIMLDWDPTRKQGYHLQSKGGARIHKVCCCCGK